MSYPVPKPGLVRVAGQAPSLGSREYAIDLIARYPSLSEPELEQLIELFPRLRALDIALMMSDDHLAPKLEAFCLLYRDRIGPRLPGAVILLGLLAGVLLVMLAGLGW